MKLSNLVTVTRIRTGVETTDREHVLKVLSSLISADLSIDADDVLEALEDREKLGSTAIGNGIALPHAKLESISQPIAALVTLQAPIGMRAPDDKKVDVFLAVLVPKEKGDLAQLAKVVKRMRDEDLLDRLRQAETPEAAYTALEEQQDDEFV